MVCPDICGWSALAPEHAEFPALKGVHKADYVVIGGGFTGLAAARRLAEEKPDARIILIDGKRIAGGASARNSGFAVANANPVHAQLNTPAGLSTYKTMNRIDRAGVAELRRLVSLHQLECQWEDSGSIHAAHSPRLFKGLRHQLEALEHLGVDARLIEGTDLEKRLGTSFYRLGVETPGGALLQPAMLGQGLLGALLKQIDCFENSPVESISRGRTHWTVQLAHGSVTADCVIVAVNAFFPRLGLKRLRLFPLALTASLTRVLTATEEREIGYAASWGILSPLDLGATMRLTQDRRILIRNTADYAPSGIGGAKLAAGRKVHAEGLKKRFSFLDESAIAFSWSGNVCVSRNAKPVFEESQPGLFLCGGYNASGVSRSTIMGKLIADLALDRQSELLGDALDIAKPNLVPPRPFLDFGAKFRLMTGRYSARSEL
jgi:glycine/D-amino acid oxidase-like deaminating enzyme